jgi:hypothetical protein
MSKEYNGWNNYATWRVNLEILGDIDFDDHVTVDELKEIVEDVVFSNVEDGRSLCTDYARAFISEVNFYEIAESINAEIDLQPKYED